MRWVVTVEYVVTADDEAGAEWAAQSDDWDESQILTVAALDQGDTEFVDRLVAEQIERRDQENTDA